MTRLVQLNKILMGWERKEFTQEKLIEIILERAFYAKRSNNDDQGSIITVDQMVMDLGFKRPEQIIKKLEAKKIIRQNGSGYELIADESKCLICWRYSDNEYLGMDNVKRPKETKVFDYEREDHLKSMHYYKENRIEQAGGIDKLFTKQDLPLKVEHEFKFISLEDNKATFQCVKCNKEIMVYLDVKNCDNGN